MKAAVYTHYGPPEVVHIEDLPTPFPTDNQVLIKIRAASVAAGDWRMRRADPFAARLFNGLFRPRRVTILGFELAGEIEAVGKGVTGFKPGDQVFAACGMAFGAHAEYVCLPVKANPQKGREIAPKPSKLSFEEAAAVPVGATTALRFLRKGSIRKDIEVLIYGASGSVGTYAVQLAKYYGARVTAVCSTAHLDMVHSLGADRVIDYKKEDFTQNGVAYDLIMDTVGNVPWSRAQGSLRPGGRLLAVAGSLPDMLRMPWVALTSDKKLLAGVATESAGDLQLLAELTSTANYRPVIDRSYPLAQMAEAHRYVDGGHKRGNVVISVE